MATATEILKYKELTLKALLELKVMPKKDLEDMVTDSGICFYLLLKIKKDMITEGMSVCDMYSLRRTVYELLYNSWEHFSGDMDYPITTQKDEGYSEFQDGNFETMWVCGDYADLRWDLVNHMISELEKEL